MPESFSPRRFVELSQKLHGLENELASWRDRSELGEKFEKHNSQVRRVQTHLEPLLKEVRGDLKEDGEIVAVARSVEQVILAVYRIWEFFRGKFAQRQEERFAPFLAAADEFAWACYQPARALAHPNAGDSRMREPPLVFFNGGWSPFAVPRARAYRGEEVPNEPLTGPRLQAVLRSLPVPVIGLPWYQRDLLPDALVLGHEVGHLVEEDFQLTPVIAKAAEAAAAERRPAWASWIGEIFADVYGCLSAGPAYVATLMDILAGDPGTITTEVRRELSWGDYPTAWLRVLINLEVLGQMGFTTEARRLSDSWRAGYPSHAMTAYEADVPAVVKSLLDGPYPTLQGKALNQVIDFSSDMVRNAKTSVVSVREGSAVGSQEIRTLFAASRLLYEADPKQFATSSPALFRTILASLQPGTRAGERPLPENEQREQADGDRVRGTELLNSLLKEIGGNSRPSSDSADP